MPQSRFPAKGAKSHHPPPLLIRGGEPGNSPPWIRRGQEWLISESFLCFHRHSRIGRRILGSKSRKVEESRSQTMTYCPTTSRPCRDVPSRLLAYTIGHSLSSGWGGMGQFSRARANSRGRTAQGGHNGRPQSGEWAGAGSRRRKVGIELTRALVFQGRIHPDKKKVWKNHQALSFRAKRGICICLFSKR
jgi:hypothetical protein